MLSPQWTGGGGEGVDEKRGRQAPASSSAWKGMAGHGRELQARGLPRNEGPSASNSPGRQQRFLWVPDTLRTWAPHPGAKELGSVLNPRVAWPP